MESFRSRLNEIKRAMDDDVYRKRVLLLCQQSEPKSFDEYSSSGSFRRLEKFESSTYSEVLRAIDLADNNRPVVMKIMRALSKGVIRLMPSVTTKGCQAYNDILNELVVTQALSQLHDGVILNGQPNALYRTHFFCLIQEIKVVTGNLSRTLSRSKKTRKINPKVMPRPVAASKALAQAPTASRPSEVAPAQDGPSAGNLSVQMIKLDTNPNAAPSEATSSTTAASDMSTSFASSNQNTSSNQLTANDSSGVESSVADTEQPEEPNSNAAETEMVSTAPHTNGKNEVDSAKQIRDDEMLNLPEEDRMLMEALPNEYVVSVMRHDGQPLWYEMSNKKLNPAQLTSVLIQVIVGLAIAENVYLYEHRDLHVSNILIKHTTNESIPFILDGQRYVIMSKGVKATIIDATFSRLTFNGKVYYRDLTSTLRAYSTKKTPTKMSLQNRSYRQMVRVTMNKWSEFTPKTNLIWLTYLCETLMKNEIMKSDPTLLGEMKKIRDCTLKVKTTYDLLSYFPLRQDDGPVTRKGPPNQRDNSFLRKVDNAIDKSSC